MHFIMKKSFKNKSLLEFLRVVVLFKLFFLIFTVKTAFSSNNLNEMIDIPIKRPLNLNELEESADTIFNLIQKVGGKPIINVKKTNVKKNETLSVLLQRVRFNSNDTKKIINSIYKLRNGYKILNSLPVNMEVYYSEPSDLTGGAIKFTYVKKKDLFVWQDLQGNYLAQEFLRPTTFVKTFIKGKINSSLYESALKYGMPDNALHEMIKLLGFTIDFQREIRKGDKFEVLFTKEIDVLKNRILKTNPLSFVSITLSRKTLSFFKYNDEFGSPQYYDEKGYSSKRTIMMTPINGARLSSKYGNRKHPILGYTKMHKGLDFAAPIGTPVFAAGDGIIEVAGWNGSYGRYVKIRHKGIYKTAYAHLSKIHKKARVGNRILQGNTIGYVGSSGRSTGPHLHYEVLIHNKQVNPMKIKLPSGKNLPKKKLIDYKKHVKEILKQKYTLEKNLNSGQIADNLNMIIPEKLIKINF